MEEHLKKIKSLLKFYKKNRVEIELKVSYNNGTIIKGMIISMNHLFNKWIVLQAASGSVIKVFLQDIEPDSIFPPEFAKNKKESEKKARDPISSKIRYAVFKRDKFVCQYCGACGPNVELEIDHKIPVSRGGTDDMDNLKTACFECNRGKGMSV